MWIFIWENEDQWSMMTWYRHFWCLYCGRDASKNQDHNEDKYQKGIKEPVSVGKWSCNMSSLYSKGDVWVGKFGVMIALPVWPESAAEHTIWDRTLNQTPSGFRWTRNLAEVKTTHRSYMQNFADHECGTYLFAYLKCETCKLIHWSRNLGVPASLFAESWMQSKNLVKIYL